MTPKFMMSFTDAYGRLQNYRLSGEPCEMQTGIFRRLVKYGYKVDSLISFISFDEDGETLSGNGASISAAADSGELLRYLGGV